MKRRSGSCLHELRQTHDKMEWLSKMVGIVQRVCMFCKSGRGALQKSCKKNRGSLNKIDKQDEKSEKEEERKKNMMNKRDKLRIWDPSWGNQIRVQIIGDSNLVVKWMNGRRKINNQKFRVEVQKTQNLLDKTDIRPMADHLDLYA